MDEDEIDRLLRELGVELPDLADDAPHDGLAPRFDDLNDYGDEWQ